jgi:hypothetical protein
MSVKNGMSMTLFDSIEALLRKADGHHPFERTEFDFVIPAQSEDGFDIRVVDDHPPEGWQIYLGSKGANTYRSDPADVLNVVKAALSKSGRLREMQKRFSLKVNLEQFDGNEWRPVHRSTIAPCISLFRERSERIFQNSVLD